jgi:hypothetical protein
VAGLAVRLATERLDEVPRGGAGRARRFKIEGLKYLIMKESNIMGALVEAKGRTTVA